MISGRLAFPVSFQHTLPILFGVRKVVKGNIFVNAKEFYIFTFIPIIRFEGKFIKVILAKSINNWIYYKFNITDTTSLSIACFKFENNITWVINDEYFLWTVNFFVSLFFPVLWKKNICQTLRRRANLEKTYLIHRMTYQFCISDSFDMCQVARAFRVVYLTFKGFCLLYFG